MNDRKRRKKQENSDGRKDRKIKEGQEMKENK
jgi:hypothetical protein